MSAVKSPRWDSSPRCGFLDYKSHVTWKMAINRPTLTAFWLNRSLIQGSAPLVCAIYEPQTGRKCNIDLGGGAADGTAVSLRLHNEREREREKKSKWVHFFDSKCALCGLLLAFVRGHRKEGPSPLFMFRNQLAENEPLIDLFKTKRKNQVGGPEMKSRSTRRQIAWQIVNNAAKLISGIVFLLPFSFSFSQNCLSATKRWKAMEQIPETYIGHLLKRWNVSAKWSEPL